MYHEYELLTKHVRQACASYLQPLSEEDLEDDSLQCKMIKVSDERLAACLDMETVTYRVREMPAGDCNTFSSLHNKLSAAAISRSQQDTDHTQLGQQYLEPDTIEVRVNGGLKRPRDSGIISPEDGLPNPAKRPRISTLPIPRAVSPGLFTVKAHLPPQDTGAERDDAQEMFQSVPAELFSCGSQVSPSNHTAMQVLSPSHVARTLPSSSPSTSVSLLSSSLLTSSMSSSLSSSSTSTISLITKVSASTSAGSYSSSPYVHISCPSTKQQTCHSTHILNSNPSLACPVSVGHSLLVNAANSGRETTPQVMAVAAGRLHTGQTTPQVMAVAAGRLHTDQTVGSASTITTTSISPPLIAGPGGGVGTTRFVLAGPGSQTILAPQGAGPGTALLLAAGAAAGNHRILVRHPSLAGTVTQRQDRQGRVSQQQAAAAVAAAPTAAVAAPTAFRSLLAPSATPQAANVLTKPTEVKVSRQLFHDATKSKSTSSLFGSSKTISLLTNGKARASSSAVVSDPYQSQVAASGVSNTYVLEGSGKEILPAARSVPNVQERSIISSSSKTLETPPSGQQFVTSPNKSASTNSHIGMGVVVGAQAISDMDVMDLELPAVDDIGSTLGPTPTDSFNDSFTSNSSSGVTTMVAGTHFLSHSQAGSVADSLLTTHKPNGDVIAVANSKTSLTSCDPSHNSLSSSSLPNGNNSATMFVSNSLKPAGFSPVKLNVNHGGSESAVHTNSALFSQSMKSVSDDTGLGTGLSELQFSEHAEHLPQPGAPSGQFSNGDVTPTDPPAELSSGLETRGHRRLGSDRGDAGEQSPGD
ncbi:hypothetical protein EGW08_022041 [Elysia chlorotica]|uniref:Uncharacterized protein n=1 Tax=Elysia chlorotica TaxID=188477 RepID=A0A433SLZ8_ELYCH|nr:hypothetical protein EGW08_022041 [Elysia chlorotica]